MGPTLSEVNDSPAVPSGALPAGLRAELTAFRRDMSHRPGTGRQDSRTAEAAAEAAKAAAEAVTSRLEQAGLRPRALPGGTGVVCDIGAADPARPRLALHTDIDVLLLGAGLVLAGLEREGRLPRPVRLILQPAGDAAMGGALDAIEADVLEGVGRILAVHGDPGTAVGRIGLRQGPITSAADRLVLKLDGAGGHSARPHLTTDLVMATAKMATELPAVLARRMDPRSGVKVVWDRIEAGHACNVIPQHAELEGTVHCLDRAAWGDAPDLVHEVIDQVAGMYRAKCEIQYQRVVPPVVNEMASTELLRKAMTLRHGALAVEDTEQSLACEDFAWYLEQVPGALARLGLRPADGAPRHDVRSGEPDGVEDAVTTGVELLTAAALLV
ncbi:amidohydrolase [Streptomyces sp. H10-C2]|uniref:amidohydrolase n=1 Tax=unclassified Streptomyces TaxID=2593676 RepID=UPI0024BAFB47|nr:MULTISPECIES: amidohydrolase [unclassified Streptomyces]MDJ0340502.1 amidohydrolase [Streptomyces sp. PH10-H1]MDJ0370150.1 amidohydrolase [Streptomyces sp. H10-C2]